MFMLLVTAWTASAQPCGDNEEWQPEQPEGSCDNPSRPRGQPGQWGCFCKPNCVRHGPQRRCIPVEECPVRTTAAPVVSSSSAATPGSSSAAAPSSSSAPLVAVCAKVIPGICQVGDLLSLVQCNQACIIAGLHVGVCLALPSPFNLGALVCVCVS